MQPHQEPVKPEVQGPSSTMEPSDESNSLRAHETGVLGKRSSRLKGRTALITGAAQGIGAAIAKLYASEGASVMLSDRDLAGAQAVCEQIRSAYGVPAFAVEMNAASPEDNERAIAESIACFGRLDILVCSAGIVRPARPIEDISPEDWSQVLDVNLMGCVYATRSFAAHAKHVSATTESNHGRVIYIASVAGQVGGVSAEMTYSVSKAGVLCLCKSVARQLGAYGVTVNAISPGTIETRMTQVLDYPDSIKQSIALGRYGEVDDIASAALYLASDDGKYVTGASIDVNGGIFMR